MATESSPRQDQGQPTRPTAARGAPVDRAGPGESRPGSALVGPLPVPVAMLARAAVAAATVVMAVIHLHLWSAGYKNVHIIGVLFLLNGIIGFALAGAVLIIPTRLLGAAAAAITGFTAGTLFGLILSLTTGLFGFREFTGAPFLDETLWVESTGIVTGAALTATYARSTLAWWHKNRPPRLRDTDARR